MNLVTNCPLCEQHALHVIEEQLSQCLYCCFVTSEKFSITNEECAEFNKLPHDMQKMAKRHNDQYWIPSVMTLPMGVINPVLVDKNLFWAYAPLVDIPENDRDQYTTGDGRFYEHRYDQSRTKLFTEFHTALEELNEKYSPKKQKIKLPKLEQINASPDKS